MIELGRKVKDKITGHTGIVTGFTTYISGCNQALVVAPVKADGSEGNAQWIDEQRLDYVDESKIMLDNSKTPGCDRAAPMR